MNKVRAKGTRIRAAGALFRGETVLIARHEGKPFWIFPGGTVEWGESLEEAVVREIKEETGLDATVKRLLYVGDFMEPDRRTLDFLFMIEETGGALARETSENVEELEFVSLEELDGRPSAPHVMFQRFLEDWRTGWPVGDCYVGRYGPGSD